MHLRAKLLLGYMLFIAALMVLGGWSAWHLREMGGVSRHIIANNYDSVIAAQDMKESLERQDSAALFALLGQHERARAQLREHRRRFNAAFEKAAHNITEPGENELIESIRHNRDTYYHPSTRFWRSWYLYQWMLEHKPTRSVLAVPISPNSNLCFISSARAVTACCI